MNRKGYLNRMAKDQMACLCPACRYKTRHLTQPSKDGEGKVDIVCEWCGKIVQAGITDYAPYQYVRIFAK